MELPCILCVLFVVVQLLCLTLCDSTDCSTPGFPVLHYFSEFAQTHVCWVNDAIQPSCPLSPSFPSAFNLSQHQGLFQWVGSLCQMPKILELQLQHKFFQQIFRVDFLAIHWTLKSLFQHHSLKASILQRSTSNSRINMWLMEKTIALSAKWCLCSLIHCLGLS